MLASLASVGGGLRHVFGEAVVYAAVARVSEEEGHVTTGSFA
jgi:hypothetical protein